MFTKFLELDFVIQSFKLSVTSLYLVILDKSTWLVYLNLKNTCCSFNVVTDDCAESSEIVTCNLFLIGYCGNCTCY